MRKRAVGQVGLAAADELKDLRKHIERLEKRLAKLEADSKPKPKPSAKPRTTTATTRAEACRAEAAARRPSLPASPES